MAEVAVVAVEAVVVVVIIVVVLVRCQWCSEDTNSSPIAVKISESKFFCQFVKMLKNPSF